MGILAHVAGAVSKESLPYLCKRCYIFPTRRAGYQFRQSLQTRFPDTAFIFPEILTIQELFRHYADDAVADEFTLLTILYPLHESLTRSGQPFDKFLPWGQQILKDFDEIDKYLVTADNLFNAVFAQKELEAEFDLGEAGSQYLRDFLRTIDSERSGMYQDAFLKTWRILGDLYPLFQNALRGQQICYEGMAYRELVDKLRSNALQLPYDQIHFCGFNAFSTSEEALVQQLAADYHIETWWDADDHFLEDAHHEAGNFLRRYKTMFSGDRHHWITEGVAPEAKAVQVTGIPSNIGQAAYAAQQLESNGGRSTCIVLCDEQLLLPLLRLLPHYAVNITMGFPVAHSAPFMIVRQMLNLYRNAKTGGSPAYYYRDMLAVCEDPYLSSLFRDLAGFKEKLAMSVPFLPEPILKAHLKDPEQAGLFHAGGHAPQLIGQLIRLLEPIQSADLYFNLPKTHILKALYALRQQVESSGVEISASGLHRILLAHFSAARIPFGSDLESPVQIMGFLETRLQDFDQVVILSLNDDILPGTNRTNTFIPYNIRRSFGMPTFEQFDGVNAYHFYRLLKRAKAVDLVYNNAMSDNASEKSRFIRQIEFEWPAITTQQLHPDIRQDRQAPASISIRKTNDMREALQKQAFSPSALKTYLNCPVQFYLRYIAGIYEPDELQADPDAAQFGNVLHHAMELFYKPMTGLPIGINGIGTALQQKPFSEYLDEGAEAAGIPRSLFHGKNKLQWRVLERIGLVILENDGKEEPFELLRAEEELRMEGFRLDNGTTITIKGKVDRIDKLADGRIRIIDYKTGKVNLATFPRNDSDKETNKFLEKLFNETSTDYSVSLQGMIYALLYRHADPEAAILVGFHKAGDLSSGIQYLNDGEPVPGWVLQVFEERLRKLLNEIVYEKDSFDSSPDESAYQYSAYGSLLGRD